MGSTSSAHTGKTSSEYLEVLRRAISVLTSSLDLEQALSNTISACLPTLGDFGFFDVVLDDGVRRTAAAHQNAELAAMLNGTRWVRHEHEQMNLCALSSGYTALHPDTDDAWWRAAFPGVHRALPFRSMLTVPLRHGDELIGALTLFMADSGRNHSSEEVAIAENLAGIAAPIVVNARLLQRQQAAQAALRLSEERLRTATNAGKIGIWDWDITTNRVTWSDRTYELHGLQQGEFGGTAEAFAALVHPEDRAETWGKIQAAMQQGDSFQHEFRLIWPDTSIHWLSTWAQVYRDSAGLAVRMVGSTIEITGQKTTEAGLTSLNAQLEQRVASSTSDRDRIWRMSHDILAVASFNGYFVTVNPAFTRILGWEEAELSEIPFLDLVDPAQREEAVVKLDELAQGLPVQDYEVSYRHKNGQYRWLSWTAIAEGDLMYGVGRDVTEIRQQREDFLQAAERRLHLALSVGGMGSWEWHRDSGRIVWWPGMAAVHGLPPGSTLEDVGDYANLVHPADRELLMSNVDDWDRTDPSFRVEYRVIWPDGSVHWLEGRSELFRDADGVPVQKAGVCLDITQRKLTERNLRFLAQVSAELAEIISPEDTLRKVALLAVPEFADWCAVDLLDEQGELKRVAVAHIDPAKIALGYSLNERYPPDPNAPSGVWNVIRTGAAELVPVITEELLAASVRDPEYLQILRDLGLKSYICAPLSVRGKILGVISFVAAESQMIYSAADTALAEDVAHRAAIAVENAILYRSLREADKRKDDFLAMLAHELRNPLAPVKVAADLLSMPLSAEALAQTSAIISRQLNHMTGLVDDLLDVSRVTQGRVAIEHQPLDVRGVIRAAVEQVQPLIVQCRHELILDLVEESVWVEGDEKRLVQVLANILNNAAKYTPEGGTIRVLLRAMPESVDIEVIDSGIGMTADLINNAFDLFVQGERKADRAQGGLGLGLAIVKSLVNLHGGSIHASSDGPDKGSTFYVTLPRLVTQPGADGNSITPHCDDTGEKRLRLLIVDDNRDAANTLALFLEMKGHSVRVAHTPHSALTMIHGHDFDAVLLDIGLPDMDGNELARRIRSSVAHCSPTIIAITGYGQECDRKVAQEAGIDHYFVKPVDSGELLRLLSRVGPAAGPQ